MTSLFQMAEMRAKKRIAEKELEKIIAEHTEHTNCDDADRIVVKLSGLSLVTHQIAHKSAFHSFSGAIDLQLDNNLLTAIPKGLFAIMKHIEQLALSNNSLATLPADICNLTNLKELRVNNNKLVNLPGELGQCKNLVLLHIGSNV